MDAESLLRQVVTEVFGEGVDAQFMERSRPNDSYRVHLHSTHTERNAGLYIAPSAEWFQVYLFDDLNVSAFLIEYDEDNRPGVLRTLAHVAASYLNGEGSVENKRRPWRQVPTYVVTVDGKRWELGRRTSKAG